MNDNLILELKSTIEKMKLEILKKQEKLECLIEEYQKIMSVEFEDDSIDNNDN